MINRAFSFASLLFLGASGILSGAACAADLPSAVSACTPGQEAQGTQYERRTRGETPATIEGVVTVSPREARCLMKKLGTELTVIAAVGDQRKLPGAIPMPWAASSSPAAQAKLAEDLGTLTRGRRTQPVLVYCHHTHCALSQLAALNMVRAGYGKVYWLRAGMDGWQQAGYAFEGETEKDPAERYASLLKDCAYTYAGENVAAGVASLPSNEVEAELEVNAKRIRQARKLCLEKIRPEVEDHKGRKADLAQRIAGNDAEVARSLKAAWAEFDANPAKYLTLVVEDAPLVSLSGMVERARTTRPLSASCGTYNYQIPQLNNSVLDAMSQRTDAYRACLDRVEATADGTPGFDAGQFGVYVERAERTHPYTCSMKRGRNCLPDEVWGRLGRVANRDNLKMIEQAAALEKQLAGEVVRERKRVNDFVDSVNVLVAQGNAAAEARASQRSSSGNGGYYAPPAPPATPYRRSSDASAAGIR
jgi:rhodanese-related sulfurtransferase